MSRPAVTILLLASTRLARVDVASDGRVLGSSLRMREDDSLRNAVQVLLQTGGKPGKRTRILAESLWTQVVTLPRASVEGLRAAELGRALAYELEPSSGISPADAVVAHVELQGGDSPHRQLWTTQVARLERDELARLLHTQGSRLEWLAHPAGVLAQETGPRIEVWNNATLCEERTRGVQVIAATAGRRTWERELAAWLVRVPSTVVRMRATPEVFGAMAAEARVTRDESLDSDEALLAALSAVAGLQLRPRFPRIESERGSRVSLHPLLAGLAATLGVAAFASWDLKRLEHEATTLEARVARVEAATEQAQALRREQRELSTALVQREPELTARQARIERAEALLAAHRARHSCLLSALGAHASPEIVLLELATQPGGATRIAGLATRAPAVEAFASALAPDVTALGLLCEPASVQRRAGSSAGEACDFSLVVRPSATAEPALRTSRR